MPFGPYDNFEDCVAKNSDKSSPEGFCAYLHQKITGQWPGQVKEKLPDELLAIYKAALDANKPESEAWTAVQEAAFKGGFEMTRFGWIKIFQAPKMKTVLGVKIFRKGTWTDSSGTTKEFKDKDLDAIVEAFTAGVPKIVPLKCGHTSDDFNRRIAAALKVPVEVITGDHGQGQVKLGQMISLERKGEFLVAGFDKVPEAIASLIEGGQYATVSCEVEDKVADFGPVVTGVALLGVEEPAVAGATLERALVFGGKRPGAAVLSFQVGEDIPKEIEGTFTELRGKTTELFKAENAPYYRGFLGQIRKAFDQVFGRYQAEKPPKEWWDRCITKVSGWEGVADPAAFCGSVWFHDDPIPKDSFSSDAKATEAEAALKKHAAGNQNPPAGNQDSNNQKGETDMDLKPILSALGLAETATAEEIVAAIEALKAKSMPPEEMKQFASMKSKVTALESENATLKAAKVTADHDGRYAGYLAKAKEFKAVPGKPEDLATELTILEEKAGKDAADKALAAYQKAEDLAKELGLLKGKGRVVGLSPDFEAAVLKFQKENPTTTRVDAIKSVSAANPKLWAERNKGREDQGK